jgi:hypothetical protein
MPIKGRPNRRSRPVEIHLPFDTLEDHRMASNTLREAMERRMVNFIQVKLTSFNPEHDLPSYEQSPAEICILSTTIASA